MITPGVGTLAAEAVAELYRDAELRILTRITASLAQGINSPGWDTLQLARLQLVRAEVVAELAAVNPVAAAAVQQGIDDAYLKGSASAMADVGKHLDPIAASTGARTLAVQALTRDAVGALSSVQTSILRNVDDVYRGIVAHATASVLAGAESRTAATQGAIDSFLSRGITGVDTKRGRMDLATYSTMAMRTATARSAIAGHSDSMDEMGLDLVVIHPGPRACKICDKWARAVLLRAGAPKEPITNLLTGKPTTVAIGGTLAEARAGGYGHPNCRCGLAAYLPGITKAEDLKRPPHDEAAYKAQQQQRAIERQIRAWKQRGATALTPAGQQLAKRKTAAWQGAMRDHLGKHPALKRQGKREQIGGIFSGNPGQASRPPGRKGSTTPKAVAPPKAPTAPKIALPPSTTPKLDGLKRMPTGEDTTTTAKLANPGYRLGGEYAINCTNTTATFELRQRGYDVIAKPLPKTIGRYHTQIMDVWRQADGTKRAFTHAKNRAGVEAEVAAWPDGARGFITIDWKGRKSAHIFSVERGPDGKPVYHEPQAPEQGSAETAKYLDRVSPGRVFIARTDDLDMTDTLADWVDEATPARQAEIDAKLASTATAKDAARVKYEALDAQTRALYKRIEAARDAMHADKNATTTMEFYRLSMEAEPLNKKRMAAFRKWSKM